MSKLKINANGTVDFITRAGNDYVKHSMPANEAEKIIKANKSTTDTKTFPGFTIRAGEYWFNSENDTEE